MNTKQTSLSVIAKLTKAQQNALGRVCINQGEMINKMVAQRLIDMGLIHRVTRTIEPSHSDPPWMRFDVVDYEPASIAVHMAWCQWCSETIKDE